jgi:hypothetical protein
MDEWTTTDKGACRMRSVERLEDGTRMMEEEMISLCFLAFYGVWKLVVLLAHGSRL